ncbi:MAG: polymerase, beta-like region [Solirubrobacterales bacterium]|nr:polymerase, beta-like region [Solirubrobacterales bacterium]
MSRALSASAGRLGCSERTLRRYVNEGLLRGRRLAWSRLELSHAEEEYLAHHWELLSRLRMGLRTEPAVRLAVLFGSAAVGEDDESSDVDLLVIRRNPAPRTLAGLRMRLRRALGRPVDLVDLEQAETMPTLLADVIREGRVLVDRDGLWQGLLARRREIFEAAQREEQATARRARETVAAARERIAAATC